MTWLMNKQLTNLLHIITYNTAAAAGMLAGSSLAIYPALLLLIEQPSAAADHDHAAPNTCSAALLVQTVELLCVCRGTAKLLTAGTGSR